jgi:alkylation response protein AidB-like acyl-CoA dehydrogenase
VKLADMYINLRAARLRLQGRRPPTMAKTPAKTAMCANISPTKWVSRRRRMRKIHGGIGLTTDLPIEKFA